MGIISVKFQEKQVQELSEKLFEMNSIQFNSVADKNITEMFNRAKRRIPPSEGGTPFDTGNLRSSVYKKSGCIVTAFDMEMGYAEDYAPHVEYGHRTKDGGWVSGQHFLKANVDIQRPIYKQDLKDAIKKG